MPTPSVGNTGELRAIPVPGIGDVFPGESVADLIVDALALGGLRFHEGDILVVKHKIVSKAEGRMVALDSVKPSAAAKSFARNNGMAADARVVELALREARRVVRKKHVLITETAARAGVRQQRRGCLQRGRRQDCGAAARRCRPLRGANSQRIKEAHRTAHSRHHS